jgi:hypothetical protein
MILSAINSASAATALPQPSPVPITGQAANGARMGSLVAARQTNPMAHSVRRAGSAPPAPSQSSTPALCAAFCRERKQPPPPPPHAARGANHRPAGPAANKTTGPVLTQAASPLPSRPKHVHRKH